MADIKWSSFPSTTSTTTGDSVVGLHSGANECFLISATPTASAITLWDANINLSANNFLSGYATYTASQTLTIASPYSIYMTGSTAAQAITLPVVSTYAVAGGMFMFMNNSSVSWAINSSGANLVVTLPSMAMVIVECILITGTTAASWNAMPITYMSAGGGGVNSGLINQLAYYATAGTQLSGLATLDNGVLITSATGVPELLANSGTAGYALTANSGAPPSWQAVTGGLSTVAASTTPITANINTIYYITDASKVTITLPATVAAGSIVAIVGQGAGGWQMNPGSGQTININGGVASTSIASGGSTDCMEVLCTVANTTWTTRSYVTTVGFTYS